MRTDWRDRAQFLAIYEDGERVPLSGASTLVSAITKAKSRIQSFNIYHSSQNELTAIPKYREHHEGERPCQRK